MRGFMFKFMVVDRSVRTKDRNKDRPGTGILWRAYRDIINIDFDRNGAEGGYTNADLPFRQIVISIGHGAFKVAIDVEVDLIANTGHGKDVALLSGFNME